MYIYIYIYTYVYICIYMHITICTYVRVSTHKATLNASITHTFTLGNAHFNTQASRLVTYCTYSWIMAYV